MDSIATGMHMNKMYTLGTHIEIVTDHAPLVPIYNNVSKPKQLCVNKNKLLSFQYNVIHQPGRPSGARIYTS